MYLILTRIFGTIVAMTWLPLHEKGSSGMMLYVLNCGPLPNVLQKQKKIARVLTRVWK